MEGTILCVIEKVDIVEKVAFLDLFVGCEETSCVLQLEICLVLEIVFFKEIYMKWGCQLFDSYDNIGKSCFLLSPDFVFVD